MWLPKRVSNFLKQRDARKRQRARQKAIKYHDLSLTDFQKYERQFSSSFRDQTKQQEQFEYYQNQAVKQRYYQRKAKDLIHNKAQKPWLYEPQFGVPRDVDPIELRRLALNPMAQLCISTKRNFIKGVPWQIIEADISKKSLKDPYQRKNDRKFIRAKEDAQERKPGKDNLIDEAAKLLTKPNNIGDPLSHLLAEAISDLEEVGAATWVLYYNEKDYETARIWREEGGGDTYERPKKGARPKRIKSFDNLQFNKDEDKWQRLHGYYHFPRSWMQASVMQRPLYMDRKEIVWFETEPRSDRFYPMSNTEKARIDLDLEMLLLEQETDYSAEGLMSPGILYAKGEGWNPQEYEKYKIYMEEEVKGHPEIIPFIDKELGWLQLTQNFREAQYLERQLWRSKRIAGQYQMNLTVIGLQDENVSRATAYAEMALNMDKGAGPLLLDMEHIINTQIFWPYFCPDKSYIFAFDPEADLGKKERKWTMSAGAWQAGLITQNQALNEMGMEERGPEGDEYMEQPQGGMGDEGGFGGGGFGGYNPRESIADGGSDFNKGKKKSNKERISISDRSEAPEGASIEEGPRGGLYYESGDVGDGDDDRGGEVKPDTRSVEERKAEEKKRMTEWYDKAKAQDLANTESITDAVAEYTSKAFTDMNRVLRGEEPEELTPEEVNTLNEQTSEFLKEAPKYEGETYRGMLWEQGGFGGDVEEEFNEFLSQFHEGEEVSLNTFTSTSAREAYATGFMSSDTDEDAQILFKIQSKSGVYLDGMSAFGDGEEEVLMDHNKKYEVISRTETGGGGRRDPVGWEIVLREV